MVEYEVIGKDGKHFSVTDYCFRGLYKEFESTGLCRLMLDGVDAEDEDDLYDQFEESRSALDKVIYIASCDLFKEIIESTSWLAEGIISYNESSVVVRGDMEGDRIFHTLSTLRNIKEYYGSTYKHFRESYDPKTALFLTMFFNVGSDYRGKRYYYGYNMHMDYMWCNAGSITVGAAKNLWVNGPTWRQSVGSISNDFDCGNFTPSIIDEYLTDEDDEDFDDDDTGEVSSINLLRLYHSFELDSSEDTDKSLLFANGVDSSGEDVLHSLVEITQGI